MSVVARLSLRLAPAALLAALALPAGAQGFKLTLTPEGNVARFITRETFINVETPFEPVGETKGVTGAIVFGKDGKIDAATSKITVDLTTLATDNSMRDGQLKRQSLETDKFPTAVVVPTGATGLPAAVPTTGALNFTLQTNVTIHGVTKPVTWTVTATAKDGKYTGKAKSQVLFADFGLTKPRSGRVLSIVDEVRLEYDFSFVREAVK